MSRESKESGILGSLFFILISIVIITDTMREVKFYYNDSIINVNSTEEFVKLKDNSIAKISIPLNFKEALSVSYVSQREFILIPFQDLQSKLIYVLEEPIAGGTLASLQKSLQGRVVSKNFDDSWDVFGKSMKLKRIFRGNNISITDETLLIYDAPKELPSLWQFFLFGLAIIYLIYEAYSFLGIFKKKTENPKD